MLIHLFTFMFYFVRLSHQVCVDVQSDTEAVLGKTMRLTCIDCMKREEVQSKTYVDWYYKPNITQRSIHIFKYWDKNGTALESHLKERLEWNGSKDLQDLSIQIHNVKFTDSGFYECKVFREFQFPYYTPTVEKIKNITLTVIETRGEDPTAIYSEIMMYVLLVFLTFWLLVEMVYCYRKISKSDEPAQDTATNYLAIPSEQKDSAAAPVSE